MTGFVQLSPARAASAVARTRARLAAAGHDLPLRLWDGRELGVDREYRLVLCHPWSLRAALVPPSDLQAGEIYVGGGVDVEGSMVAALRDIAAFRERLPLPERLALARLLVRLPPPPQRFDGGRIALSGRRHDPDRDAAAVRHHYDVGNDLYRLFLDRDLVYSCAYFADEDGHASVTDRAVLDRAQRRKLELACRKLHLRSGERLLDVGCGWGSLVIHAARHHDVQAVGVTLSEQQATLARERVAEAGLADRVRIELCDYRDVRGRFDAIASVGMVEHVGADQLPNYVRTLYDTLRDGGRLLNHGITTGRRDQIRDLGAQPDNFVGRYVFPDGALVPARHMIGLLERGGFEIRDVEQLRPHYARTLQHWVANLEGAYEEAVRLVGETTARVWRAYLAGSVVGFEVGDLGVIQVLATRGDAALPLTRDHLRLSAASPRHDAA
ncbi:SAM-dependent methyltransferase [Nitriliruptor alkaliphilus]|uniref:SAM-dependent methyltransferase n=1 Tax=Nitriliruptor alkaliphilus TaxID=427918 RepID=UPI0006964A4B|nr:cyclopropane-fatty-acyl-phospholipid synthase family protein [Nitriliruptor alkaliphilus]